ncbi:hypothetical protein DSO57_1021965 [Entomophthora muscae]|uniref:Uncharacterized protein n=1 Tax=Entomophthora muscae TaxID=34485 RepID=A0ACC2TQF9_9FUNG|nr:hypothetical protein DSO57_1021965 [Entomophthora muscae]
MTLKGKDFLENEVKRLPKEGSTPAEVMVYREDARIVIKKMFEDFAILQAKYNILSKESLHLKNDNPSQPAPDNGPGYVLVTNELERYTPCFHYPFVRKNTNQFGLFTGLVLTILENHQIAPIKSCHINFHNSSFSVNNGSLKHLLGNIQSEVKFKNC